MDARIASKEEYDQARREGKVTERKIFGIIRGGFDFEGHFFFMAALKMVCIEITNLHGQE